MFIKNQFSGENYSEDFRKAMVEYCFYAVRWNKSVLIGSYVYRCI